MPLNMRFRFSPTKDGLVKVLGPLETEIMQIIWQDERSTVKKVHRKLSQQRDIAYTTVMTTMSRLAEKGDSRPIIFLTGHGDIPMSVQAMKAGAVDFLTKPVRDQTLLDAIAAAIERDVKQRTQAQVTKRNLSKLARLTPRERQVLRQVAAGRLNKQIAHELDISMTTVKAHVSAILCKLNVFSRTQAVILANQVGFEG